MCTRAAPVPSERLTFEMAMVSGLMPVNDEGSMRLSMAGSYGTSLSRVEGRLRMFAHMLVLGLFLATMATASAETVPTAKPIKIVVLGDSLSAGLGLSGAAAFPERLQNALNPRG